MPMVAWAPNRLHVQALELTLGWSDLALTRASCSTNETSSVDAQGFAGTVPLDEKNWDIAYYRSYHTNPFSKNPVPTGIVCFDQTV